LNVRPFRFGVSVNRPRPKHEWLAFARRVEALGYDTLAMPDHFGPRFAIAPALVLAAEATTRLRVGSFVYDNDFRHPALLAQEAATIDTLTDGRFDFGIGAGWLKREYDAAGITFDRGQARVERLAEALSMIKQLLTGEPVTFRGRFYQLEDLSAGFKPVQRPYPPLVIGGGGRLLLGLASEHADIISVMPRSRADGSGLKDSDATEGAFAEKIAWIEEAAGGRFAAIELNTLVQAVIVTSDVQREAERLSAEWQLPVNDVLGSPLLLIGSVEQIAATLEQRRERLGISSITVFEKDADSFSGVINRLRH
jgi:probable F420-dependent oxidoreductase